MNVAQNISFASFCELCTKITVSDKKSEVLQNFISKWRELGITLQKDEPQVDSSFYPALRFLLPQLDRDRGAYGVKEHTLANIYIRILSLPKTGKDANKLLNFRAPKSAGSHAGDFAEVTYWILKGRCSTGGELSMDDVNQHLDNIAAKHAAHDPRGVDSELVTLLKQTSAEEQKWLIRVLLKDMKLGLGQNKVLACYHPDARDLYDVSNNLDKICTTLKDPSVRLHEVEVEVMAPFRPMLSEECNVKKVDTYLKNCPAFLLETKLDGERFQIHMKDGGFKYYSRNGYDYTSSYGATRLEGLLTPQLAGQLSADVTSIILDGEMMCWNPNTKTYTTKGYNIDVKHLLSTSLHRPCLIVFDMLYLNNEVLTNLPLYHRLELLQGVLRPLQGVVELLPRHRVTTREEIWEFFNSAVDNSEEGIIMKNFLSVYKPNARKDGGWYKIKPEYTDGLMDQVDVVILGGYYGEGRRSGTVSHFLVGVAVRGDPPTVFYSMAKVGSGYTMQELEQLQIKLEPFWKKRRVGDAPPPGIEWTKEKPDVWIEPCHSFILQVKASEIIPSDLYRTEFTLRFPRVVKVRYDKQWTDCLTLDEFEEKRKNASGKLFSGHVTTADEVEAPKRAKKTTRQSTVLGAQFRGADLSGVQSKSKLLAGKEVCVMGGYEGLSKGDVEQIVAEHGGRVVQNPGSSTWCVVAEELTLRVNNMVRSGLYDVVRTCWLVQSLRQAHETCTSLPDLTPQHMLGKSNRTQAMQSRLYDQYGDHYTVPATMDTLMYSLQQAGKSDARLLNTTEWQDMDVELFSGPSTYGFFRGWVVYLDLFAVVSEPDSGATGQGKDLLLIGYDIRFYGGSVVDCIGDDVTHVILARGNYSRLSAIKNVNKERHRKFYIVCGSYVKACLSEQRILDERQFAPGL